MADTHNILKVRGVDLDVSQDGEIVSGDAADILQASPRLHEAIQVGHLRSEPTDTLPLTDNDAVVELGLEDNLILYTSVKRLKEEIIPSKQRGAVDGEVILPARLSFTNQRTRGEDGLLVESVKVLDVKSRLLDAAAKKGGEFAARKIAEKIEDQLVGPDTLYRIADDQGKGAPKLIPATRQDIVTTAPLLLFIHGTASSTIGSFSELWESTGQVGDTVWQDIQKEYKNNIFALEHRTLTHSPIDNMVDLMEVLPTGCRLHLVSHSRGGLVGELLCRAQFNNSREPFTREDIELFDSEKVAGIEGLFTGGEKDYRHHQEQLKKLNTLLLEKQPVVDRFVRVACPARGTTLASGKLDVYLSGILNVIGLIPQLRASPVYSLLKAFTLAVAKERTRPEHLPGLEAQMPGSPFIAMLNSSQESVKAHLAVIKGDIEPTGILKKISIFFLDRFYESDHDLVVNTPSMDGGARRENQVPVLFDQGKDINHFRYFENPRTRRGLFSGLTDKALPPRGFQLEEQKAVEIARTHPRGKMHDEVPSVFVLPGITGSHLEVDGNRIWIDFFDLVRGRFSELSYVKESSDLTHPQHGVRADGPVAKAYGDLVDYLAQSHYVIPFAYDWRRSILRTGEELGAAVDERLRNSDKPVRIVAHSMGGLVTRAMISRCPKVWERMCARKGSRVLMLGTPNRGSYSIARIFARQDKLIKMLALADLRHNQNELLDIIRFFPGVLELLPVNEDGRIDIDDTTWDDFAEVLPGDWNRPAKDALKNAQNTWDILHKTTLDPERIFYVAGKAERTPVSVTVETEGGDGGIHFTPTDQGDGQVPWETGIPEGIKCWFVSAVHGDIPDHSQAYEAFLEILQTGSTHLLATQAPVARGVLEDDVMQPDIVDVFPSEDAILAAGMGKSAPGIRREKVTMPLLHVSVVHGDLCFSRSPLAVGHYQGDTIVSAEAVLDRLLNYRLSKRLQKGVYPGPLLTNEVLFNHSDEQFPGAVIVGLGEVGDLTSGGLTSGFRDAVIRYVLIGRETNQFNGKPIELSTLLIGTGASKLSIKDSVASLMRGVLQANRILAGSTNNFDLIVSKLDIVELHEDVAIAAQYALLSTAENAEFSSAISHEATIQQGNGGRTRAFFNEEEEWWQRLRIEATADGGLKFTSLAAQARADMRIQAIQRQSIEPFLRELTAQTSVSSDAGRVLFELLVPPEYKSHAAENHRLLLIVDKDAASYPWELLEYEGRDGNESLAIKAGMIRQLATHHQSRSEICTDLKALVIGDPLTGRNSHFPKLPGAREEARAVNRVLTENRVEVEDLLIEESGVTILSRLMTGRYGILHLAGHGVVDYQRPGLPKEAVSHDGKQAELITGMVIGENQFLTPIEIRQMPYTPAFVFINCCHLGKVTDEAGAQTKRRYYLAANLATQLIEQGVKAVIAAGWAVDDAAALTFAQSFYAKFLDGETFGEAVKEARSKTQAKHSSVNTWGAYQCYGDPGFRISGLTGKQAMSGIKPFVSLSEYVVAIRNIGQSATAASYAKAERLSANLKAVITRVPENYKSDATLLTALGDAWGELDNFKEAIDAYERALQAQKALAPIRSAEQLANFKCRRAVEKAKKGDKGKVLKLTEEAVGLLGSLNDRFGESVERLALSGSCYKRRAEIDVIRKAAPQKNLIKMHEFYQRSYQKNLDLTGKVNAYPLLNALTARWLLVLAKVTDYTLQDFDMYLNSAKQANMVPEINQEYFWEAIAVTDCDLLASLKNRQLDSQAAENLAGSYREISKVASSARQMRSVEEHVGFLAALTGYLKDSQATHLRRLGTMLRGVH